MPRLLKPKRHAPFSGPLVAVIVDPSQPFFRELATGVAQYAREAGDWRLYVEEEQQRRIPDFTAWQGDGIVAALDDEGVARTVLESGFPLVAVGNAGRARAERRGIPFVYADDDRIGTLAAEHLLERGIPHLGFYGLPASTGATWSETRATAFSRRLAASGRSCSTLVARHDSTRWTLSQQELADWLTSLPKPAGVMACDDVRARHVLEACRALGLRVPHDVAVMGVDDDEFICDLADPPLSSVAPAARRIGHEAARLLDGMIRARRRADRGPSCDAAPSGSVPLRTVVPPVGVVARRSTDTLSVEDPVVARTLRTIRERAGGRLSGDDLARESGLPRWQLEGRFRRLVGRSLHDDILNVRLAEATRLVATTDLPLKAVAPRAGFRSVPYMTTVFRRHLGTTPAALRRLGRRRHEK